MPVIDVDKWQEIFLTLRRNKLRTIMTAAGVFWGIFMLIMMVGFGASLQGSVANRVRGFAANSVFVWGQRTSLPYKGFQPGRRVEFTNDDLAPIRAIAGIEHLAPRNQLGGWREGNNVTRGAKTGNFAVAGDTPEIRHIQRITVTHGRFINPIDLEHRRKIAVIGAKVYEQLFERGESPIGATIRVRGVYFQVVGVFKSLAAGDEGDRHATTIHIPLTTFQQAFNSNNQIGWIALTAQPNVSAAKLERKVRSVLVARHDVSPDDTEGVRSFNAAERFGMVQTMLRGVRMFIWFVGLMTLLAGVLGVSNIMLIVVKERTREIGIRKALGATPASVVALVVQESVVLTVLAGYAGLVTGIGAIELIGSLMSGDDFGAPRVELWVALVAAATLIGCGAIAGIIPATHAARIAPVAALRAE